MISAQLTVHHLLFSRPALRSSKKLASAHVVYGPSVSGPPSAYLQINWGIWLLLFLGGYLGGENSGGGFSPMRRRLPISNINNTLSKQVYERGKTFSMNSVLEPIFFSLNVGDDRLCLVRKLKTGIESKPLP